MSDLSTIVDYLQRYVKLGYHLNDLVHKSHVHEYAIRYHLQEERMNTEREEAAKNAWGLLLCPWVLLY